MKERGMLFNDDMVRAIDAGIKTVTRRTQGLGVLNLNMPDIYKLAGYTEVRGRLAATVSHGDEHEHSFSVLCPYGKPGDRLYVREAHAKCEMADGRQYAYRAAGDRLGCMPWTPSIHMPREASRILLEIISVSLDRLQHISIGQICKEGLARSIYEFIPVTTAFAAFEELWTSTGGDWDGNPWVWVVEFRKVEA